MSNLKDLIEEGAELVSAPTAKPQLDEAAGNNMIGFIENGYVQFFKHVEGAGSRWLSQRGYQNFKLVRSSMSLIKFEAEESTGKRYSVEVNYQLAGDGVFDARATTFAENKTGVGDFKTKVDPYRLSVQMAVEGIHAAMLRAGGDLRKKLKR